MSAWTNKTPTEEGWYWWRPYEGHGYSIMEIKKEKRKIRVSKDCGMFMCISCFDKFNSQQWQKMPQPKE